MKRTSCRAKPTHSPPSMVIEDGMLMALLLTGLFFSQFNVYGLPGSRTAVLAACLAAAVLSLVIFSLPKYRWAAALAAAAIGLLLLWYHWEDVSRGAYVVYAAIAQAITGSTGFPGCAPAPDWIWEETVLAVSFVPEDWPDWWQVEGLAALADRFLVAVIFAASLPLGWAVVRRRAFLPVFALTLPWLIPIFLAEFPPDTFSLSMIAAVWMVLALSGLTFRYDPKGGARLTVAALPAVLAALLCVCTLFPVEGYVYPDWARAAAEWLTGIGKSIDISLLPGQESVKAAEYVDLAHSGPRRYTGAAVLQVDGDFEGRLYLRGAAYAGYTGGSWERLDSGALAELETLDLEDVIVTGREPAELMLMIESSGLLEKEEGYTVTVTKTGDASDLAYIPYCVTALPDGVQYVDDSRLRFDEPQKSYTVSFYGRKPVYGSGPNEAYTQFVCEHYLDVPENLRDVLQSWWDGRDLTTPVSSSTFGLTDELTAAAAIGGIGWWLAQENRYSLLTPMTPEGEDFVEYFLTKSRQGYCVHYASAAVLLLRQIGIPARFVSGYVVEMDGSGRYVVTDASAHAWVEVYLDGYGWYPVEATIEAGPGVTQEPEETAMPTSMPTDTPELTDTPEPTATPLSSAAPSQAPSAAPDVSPPGGEGGMSVDRSWLGYGAAAFVVLCLPALYRGFRRRRWRRLTALTDNNRAALEVYGWYGRLKRWGGQTDERLEFLARKAKFSQHTLTEEERGEAMNILRRETARLTGILPVWKRWLFRYLYVWK